MSKLDIKCLDEGYSFVDICGLPLYRGSGLKCLSPSIFDIRQFRLPLYRGSGLKFPTADREAGCYWVFLCIEEVD